MSYVKIAFRNGLLILLAVWSVLTFTQIKAKGYIKFIEPNKYILQIEYILAWLMVPLVMGFIISDLKEVYREARGG